MYALDRENGVLPVEIFQYMIKNGADITQRDSVSITVYEWRHEKTRFSPMRIQRRRSALQ